ncbi:hypothetical protein V4W33_30660 [Pseudomonas aeruginosa]|uniref:hypothetical protein n=1 Tax=Pseudomonas aeruginosa TaxID=287 RepID=UPI00192A2C0C|nr:hypothetical protein [Pseudomonas aeruginosa]EKX3033559.1 hypothetical protein [Pseudomonas aeruginosa]EKX3045875.1 hypothetical protein [Pseudomonas aeruginosa]EKX3064013.1 hypothetical protein [Pseudomonas aeruginosa]EKX3101715.1 hypothetical protein [Pseudomonas aeruginosa]NCI92591.1 hypothetical protein [Pseudomonas aeruginosa]
MTDINKLRELAQRAIGFDMKNDWMFKPVISYLAAANPAAVFDLIAEIEHLRKDAARYRWLRERDLETIRQGGVFAGMTPKNIVLNLEHLDAEIDAALEGATQ